MSFFINPIGASGTSAGCEKKLLASQRIRSCNSSSVRSFFQLQTAILFFSNLRAKNNAEIMAWSRVRVKLLRVADWVVVGASEMTKAWIREVFRLCQQLVLAFSAVSLCFSLCNALLRSPFALLVMHIVFISQELRDGFGFLFCPFV